MLSNHDRGSLFIELASDIYIITMSSYFCNVCNTEFDSNYKLYRHKSRSHSTVAIMNQTESDPGLEVIDEYDRKRGLDYTEGLEVVDSYDRKRAKTENAEDDPGMEVVDSYDRKRRKSRKDDQNDPELKVVDSFSRRKKKQKESTPTDSIDDIDDFEVIDSYDEQDEIRVRGVKRTLPDGVKSMNKSRRVDKLSNSEPLKRHINVLRSKQRQTVRRYKQNEQEFMTKIKMLEDQIKDLDNLREDERKPTKLYSSVFNSVTIEELIKLRSLIVSNDFPNLLKSRKMMSALNKLFTGLVYGVIPITNPQKIALTARQKIFIRKLEKAPINTARTHIIKNKTLLRKLFSIIDDSINLVTRSYHRYSAGL